MEKSRHKILFHLNGARKLDLRSQYYVRKMLPLSIFVLNFIGEPLMYGLIATIYRFKSIQDLFGPTVFYEGMRIVSFTIFISISIHLMKDYLKECLNKIKSIPNLIIWVGGGYVVITVLLQIIEPSIFSMFDVDRSVIIQQNVKESLNEIFWLSFVSGAFLIPISEEFIFRYGIIGTNNKNIFAKVLLSSLFFGLMHAYDEHPIYITYYVCMGFILAFIYCKNDNNILYTISLHMLTNFIGIITQL
ncbi:MAG: hypothetical protein ATN32_05280 [Candidatus Epulonipiscium fishelsonii]|nr:MAG: hypothetical protein ATN32_05280 [Epulopiscium sp. AS2M-Bin002]